jgi:UrcA family protein
MSMNPIVTPRRVALGAALLLSGLGALSALANTNGAHQTRVIVAYGDLDMAQPKAGEILYGRISRAARRACEEHSRGDLAQMSQYNKCYQTAVANAVDKVNERTLTAFYRAKAQRYTPS